MKKTKRFEDFCRINTKKIGSVCKYFRSEIMEMKQSEVAEELGVSQRTVSGFELGTIDSLSLFMYYISKGLLKYIDIKELEIYAGRFLFEHYGY